MTTTIEDINLAPGEFYFGGGRKRIHTLLGSCVAITMWHPVRSIGGMCHYLLATRGLHQKLTQGHYADEAVQMFLRAIEKAGTKPRDYEVKLFGGGDMFTQNEQRPRVINVSRDNIQKGAQLLLKNDFRIKSSDLGGTRHRKIYLELWNGDVWVQRGRGVN